MKTFKCWKCGKREVANGRNQKYCGSSIKKIGCSYLQRLLKSKIVQQKWRKNHPDYWEIPEKRKRDNGYYNHEYYHRKYINLRQKNNATKQPIQ
jgi:hypothetical protein